MVGKVQKSHGPSSGLYGGCSNGIPAINISKPNTEFNSDLAREDCIMKSFVTCTLQQILLG
jgi:hypothetical protein